MAADFDETVKSKGNHPGRLCFKGDKVRYRGEEAVIISIKPLLIIKSKTRIVCGDLYNCLDFRKE